MSIIINSQKSELFFKEVFPSYSGFILSRSIYAITKLNVAEALKEGPLDVAELAKRLGLKYAHQLERVLNFLASQDIFTKLDDGRFSQSKLSEDLLWSRSGARIIKHQDMRWNALADANEASLAALHDDDDAPNQVERLSRLYLQARAIYVACSLQVFDKLNTIPRVLSEHLEQAGLVQNKVLTATGELFLDKNCQALILYDNKERWNALGAIEEAIKEGIIPFEKQAGASFFDYIGARPAMTAQFSDAMTFVSDYECAVLMPSLKEVLQPGMTVADIGGGKGRYMQEILKAYPEVRGILFDLPENVANSVLDKSLRERCQHIGGSFFEEVPQADVFLFKRVLHDWGDKECIAILEQCKKAALPGSQLVLHEMLLPQKEALMFDIQWMSCIPGQQRTLEDFTRLLNQAGWQLQSVAITPCWISQIVAI